MGIRLDWEIEAEQSQVQNSGEDQSTKLARRRMRHQYLRGADRQRPPGGRHRGRHDRLVGAAASGQSSGRVAGERCAGGGDVQHRRSAMRFGMHSAHSGGVNGENVSEVLQHADGVIVGTSIKEGGLTANPVDAERLGGLMRAIARCR